MTENADEMTAAEADPDEPDTEDEEEDLKTNRLNRLRKKLDPGLTCEAHRPDGDGDGEFCGNGQDFENGIIVGRRESEGVAPAECNRCLEEWYAEQTVLAERQSQVVALKSLGATQNQIYELLRLRFGDDDAPEMSTIWPTIRRSREKYFDCLETVLVLDDVFGEGVFDEPANEDEDENEDEEDVESGGEEIEA